MISVTFCFNFAVLPFLLKGVTLVEGDAENTKNTFLLITLNYKLVIKVNINKGMLRKSKTAVSDGIKIALTKIYIIFPACNFS